MRYGENLISQRSHVTPGNKEPNILNATIHQVKIVYNNIMDADGALLRKEFEEMACVVVKHANPCGVAIGNDLLDVYERAFNADSLSALWNYHLIKLYKRRVPVPYQKCLLKLYWPQVLSQKLLEIFKRKRILES